MCNTYLSKIIHDISLSKCVQRLGVALGRRLKDLRH